MPTISSITIPDYTPVETFPLRVDYGFGIQQQTKIVTHDFATANRKIHQRFVLGTGARNITIGRAGMSEAERASLVAFWERLGGAWKPFFCADPATGDQLTVAFADPTLSLDAMAVGMTGFSLGLFVIPSTVPEYTISETADRMPSDALTAGLLEQTQVIVPLLKITPITGDAFYIADRHVIIDGIEYHPRLLDWAGIGQTLGDQGADEAGFVLGNADRIFSQISNTVDLYKARLDFSLFHVGTLVKLDLWSGDLIDWQSQEGSPEFHISGSDGLWEMKLGYPSRKILRTCWKLPGVTCPLALDTPCDRTWDACIANSKQNYFGGIVCNPTSVTTMDNSTGLWAWGRFPLTSKSVISDSMYGMMLQEIYTEPGFKMVTVEVKVDPRDPNNPNPDPGDATQTVERVADETSDLPVDCLLAAGRDEGDFYSGLGVIGRGPIGQFGVGHVLDGQPNHGPANLGLRSCYGADPVASPSDYFNIDDLSGPKPERAAGVAFLDIRRTDDKGLQLSALSSHSMTAMIRLGLSGYSWTAPGERSTVNLTNPVWIAINMLLRARTVWDADAAVQESYFDVPAAVQAAAVCDRMVDKIVLDGSPDLTEKQYLFRGVLKDEKPLRNWLTEVLNTCLGYYLFSGGKFKVGLRSASGTRSAFTVGNIVADSLQMSPVKPAFNDLTVEFGNGNLGFIADAVPFTEQSHAALIGQNLKSTINLVGISTRSHAARYAVTRVYEELGGTTEAQWKQAREIGFRTTVLALETEPGMVCSLDHPEMPGGHGEFRIASWKLNKDFSIDIQGKTTTDEIYTLVAGGNTFDIQPYPIPFEKKYAVPDVTGLTADAPVPVVVEGTLKASITLHCQAPAELGTGSFEFQGVQVTYLTPTRTTTYPDRFSFAGAPQEDFTFSLIVPYPAVDEEWTIYLAAKSDRYTNALDLAATPSVIVSVPAKPFTGDAPDVLTFRAGTMNQTDGTWTPAMYWEPLKSKMLCDWGCLLPSDTLNWSAVALFIQTPDAYVQASDLIPADAFTQTDAGLVYFGCVAIEGADIPGTPEQWTFIACSYDRAGVPNQDPDGNPYGPAVNLMTLAPETKPITDSGQVNLSTAVGTISISNIHDITAIDIGTLTGKVDISNVTNLGTIAISTFTGKLDISKVDNLGTVAISSFTGSLDVSRIGNLNTLLIGSFTGSLDVSKVANLNTLDIASFEGVITTPQLQAGIMSDLTKYADALRPITKVASLPVPPGAAYPPNTVVLRTSDSTLWKNNAGTWAPVTASDTVTGKIADADITNITATKLVGQINAANVRSISVSQLSGTLSIGQANLVALTSLSGNLDVARINNINTINLTNLTGNLDISRVNNVNTIQINSLSGNLDCSHLSNLSALTISNLTGNLDITRVNNIGTVSINSFTGTINNLNATTVTLTGQWADGSISAVSCTKLVAGSIDVSGTGVTFSGAAGIILSNGGNIYINPGWIYGTAAKFKSLGAGWEIVGGMFPSIQSVSSGSFIDTLVYKCNGAAGATASFSIPGTDSITHYLTFNGGILSRVTLRRAACSDSQTAPSLPAAPVIKLSVGCVSACNLLRPESGPHCSRTAIMSEITLPFHPIWRCTHDRHPHPPRGAHGQRRIQSSSSLPVLRFATRLNASR